MDCGSKWDVAAPLSKEVELSLDLTGELGGDQATMTPNIASPIFNTLVLAFFVVVALGVALGAYAAVQLKKLEEKNAEQ